MKVYLLTITEWYDNEDTVKKTVYAEGALEAAANHFLIAELNAKADFEQRYESSDEYEVDEVYSIKEVLERMQKYSRLSWMVLRECEYFGDSISVELEAVEAFETCQGKEEL